MAAKTRTRIEDLLTHLGLPGTKGTNPIFMYTEPIKVTVFQRVDDMLWRAARLVTTISFSTSGFAHCGAKNVNHNQTFAKLDVSRFDAAPLIAFIAAKETNYGTETYGRIPG